MELPSLVNNLICNTEMTKANSRDYLKVCACNCGSLNYPSEYINADY